jgi:hypothetical protein
MLPVLVYSWIKVTKKDPLYVPDGLATGLPTVSVPPTITDVWEGGVAVVISGDAGYELPIWSVMVPPPLPYKVASGPLAMPISVPGSALISKFAAPYTTPRSAPITEPVKVRKPLVEMITVPPDVLWKNAPKRNPSAGLKYTEIGWGGFCCAKAVSWHNNNSAATGIPEVEYLLKNNLLRKLIIDLQVIFF